MGSAIRCALLVSIAVHLGLVSTASANNAWFKGLGHLSQTPFPYSEAWAISPDGTCVVGTSSARPSLGDGDLGWMAFRWTAEDGMAGIGALPEWPSSRALAVSQGGQVIAGSCRLGNESSRAFRWTAETGVANLGTLGNYGDYNTSTSRAVSADGQIVVGNTTSPTGFQGFRWSQAEGMVGLDDPSKGLIRTHAFGISGDGTTIVGTASLNQEWCAFRWTAAGGIESIGTDLTPTAISGDGSTMVGRQLKAGEPYVNAFRWTAETGAVDLGTLDGGAYLVEPEAVSHDGSVVIGYLTPAPNGGTMQAFIWDAQHGVRDLRSVLIEDYHLAQLQNWLQLADAHGISGDGQTMVGFGVNPEGITEAWIAHIPEPTTLMMVVLAGVALARRRAK